MIHSGLAAISLSGAAEPAEARALLEANVLGPMRVTRALLSLLCAARGRVVNIGSIAGKVPMPFMHAYAAGKAALHAWSDGLRVELAPLGCAALRSRPCANGDS